jgi:hypothetical protein
METDMTTAPIFEPIAHISDDYFPWRRKDSVASGRENIGDRNPSGTRNPTLNITDDNASGSTDGEFFAISRVHEISTRVIWC